MPHIVNWRLPNGVEDGFGVFEGEAHFAVYPPKIIETPIQAGCPPGGIVLDPFMGSGTTAVVARQLGRDYLGIELRPEYVRIAEKRLARLELL